LPLQCAVLKQPAAQAFSYPSLRTLRTSSVSTDAEPICCRRCPFNSTIDGYTLQRSKGAASSREFVATRPGAGDGSSSSSLQQQAAPMSPVMALLQRPLRRVRKTLQATFLPAGYPTSVGESGALGCGLICAAATAAAVSDFAGHVSACWVPNKRRCVWSAWLCFALCSSYSGVGCCRPRSCLLGTRQA
jgi:hypothetical protein